MRTPKLLSSSLLVVALAMGSAAFLTPQAAFAQDEDALNEARGKFQKALELEHAKNWGGALKLFREVGQIKMTPQVRYHIATCEENLGQLVTALGGYELALVQAEGMHPDFIAEVQGSIDDLKARIPKLVIERAEGSEAAQIQLDGVQIGENSIGDETPVDPGPHTVTASAPGYEEFQQTVSVQEGSVEVLKVELTKLPKGETGDGTVVQPGVVDEDPGKGMRTAGYITGGIGIPLFITGAVLVAVVAPGKTSQLKELCGEDLDCTGLTGGTLEDAKRFDRQARSNETIGWVLGGVGLAAVGTGVALVVLGSKGASEEEEQPTAGVSFQPYAPGSDAGLSFVGSF